MTSAPHPDEQVLSRFDRIRAHTECSYARAARLLGVVAVDGSEMDLRALSSALAGLGRIAPSQRPDGVVYEIPDPAAGVTVDVLRRTTGDLLRSLATGEGHPDLTDPARVLDPTWWFRCGDTAYFVSAFGPCYPASSSRFGFGATETYILFLSSESFARRRRRGADTLPAEVKTTIRVAYAAAGRPYDLALTLSPHEADRIVKPATYGAPPVPWWED